MGLFDFLKRNTGGQRNPAEMIKSRWQATKSGLFLDANNSSEPVWRVGCRTFEVWFRGLETRTGQSLGRRLAHAAAESEEYHLRRQKKTLVKGREANNWRGLMQDWQERGLGSFELLDDGEEVRFLVTRAANGPICAGSIAAAWELSTGTRHRFRWSESAGAGLLVILTPDDIESPAPRGLAESISETELISHVEDIDDLWDTLQFDSHGEWSLFSERKMMIHRDLIIRFHSFCEPYVTEIVEGRSDIISFPESREKSHVWEIASADSMREIHYSAGHHILVQDADNWIQIARRHLAMHGLGNLLSASSFDEHGGVELILLDSFENSLVNGVLLACWERAYGGNARLVISRNRAEKTIRISSVYDVSS